jgi:hydroxymethylpyrimidine pyrophosphatase-like HAD family hydrolase
MRYLALACDYDGTIARHGQVDASTLAALERLRASGRRLLLVTGRELDDLLRVLPDVGLFDCVVAENGALLYDPATREEQPLADPPPPEFLHGLERRGVSPLSSGRVIVATWEPNDAVVLQAIRDLGLELQVVFNKGAVMVLPSGVNKASGLKRALETLKLSPHNIAAVGDAENDHAFLSLCECGVAVANALESVKSRADLVTQGDHGAGVAELVDRLVTSDLAEIAPRLTRHDAVLGRAEAGDELRLPAHDGVLLVAGPSGSGKTTVTTALLERWCDAGYQFCVVDPEGDYYEFPNAIALRGADGRALAEEALRVLERPAENAVVSLLDLPLDERPPFLHALLPRLLELRAATARPHWIVIDEAHHLLPVKWQPSRGILPAELKNVVLVTVHPDHVAPAALALVSALVVVGPEPQATFDAFSSARGEPSVSLPARDGAKLAWFIAPGATPVPFHSSEPAADRRRHRRKYAEGELGEDRSFYFRGPDGRLNLRAQNLEVFIQMADGVDDETWTYHLRQKDVSRWFRDAIKDEALADETAAIEEEQGLPAGESRARVRDVIRRRYTTPA